jgi:hypothetical protein
MMSNRSNFPSATANVVADILERELDATIGDWMVLVEKDADLARVPLNFEERTGHLLTLLYDVMTYVYLVVAAWTR